MPFRVIRVLIAFFALAIAAGIAFRFKHGDADQEGLLVSGTVEVTEVNVAFKSAGRVSAVFTDEGKSVRNGQRLAQLETDELDTLRDQNAAAIEQAESQLERTQTELGRATALSAGQAIPRQQLDSAGTSYRAANAQVRMARSALKTTEVKIRDAMLRAPMSGTVLRRYVEPGETVSVGMPILTIGALDAPWVRVYVKENLLGRVKIGQKAEVSIDTFPNKRYEGTVVSISQQAEFTPKNIQTKEERVKLVFGVKVSVKNQNGELKPGMPADVRILP